MPQHARIMILSRLLTRRHVASLAPLLLIFLVACSEKTSPIRLTPCLSMAPPDRMPGAKKKAKDMRAEDMRAEDMSSPAPVEDTVTPCLSALPEAIMRPCLSPPAPRPQGALERDLLRSPAEPAQQDRALLLAKLSSRLPPDVLQRLQATPQDKD